MRCVAIIPARGGSRRIPRKNIRKFFGRPILAYSIETAQQSGLFNAGIWVSTEDAEIARLTLKLGARYHARERTLADHVTGTQEVMAHALAEIFPDLARRPEVACCIYPTAPLLSVGDLRRGFAQFASRITAYAYSVGPDGQDAGQFYFGSTQAFLARVPLAGAQQVVLGPERVCDINTEADWHRAEQMYAVLHREEPT